MLSDVHMESLPPPQQGQMRSPSSLPVSSPAAPPGSEGGAAIGSSLGSLTPGSVGGRPPSTGPLQPNSLPHCPAIHQSSSPSPARSRTPTPHPATPGLLGSQTPQPHTPNPPQLGLPAQQMQQLGAALSLDKSMQLQQQPSMPPQVGLGSSGPAQNAPLAPQHPRTPVSTWRPNEHDWYHQPEAFASLTPAIQFPVFLFNALLFVPVPFWRPSNVSAVTPPSHFCPQLSQKPSLMADGQVSTPASVSSVDMAASHSGASQDPAGALDPRGDLKQQDEEDSGPGGLMAGGGLGGKQVDIKAEKLEVRGGGRGRRTAHMRRLMLPLLLGKDC